MFDYSKQGYLVISMILIGILYTAVIANTSCNLNYDLKRQANISSKSIVIISLDKTPDEIARDSETAVINSIEQNNISKK
ncbi:hypothetical protein I6U48_16010 [Clostridium sp. PL3]|uniref:Uncharacterized protein n=1 Tax=Clostridium thailandense TaxID=2794346 RepID=A0A949WW49_9CLOT|nr:hypothetical protein [Clostridium thailandense]MBV7274402.1 hypothetical protein [Clostridium thailandense]